MGGTASPFCWNLVYDPIITILSEALGMACPTSVDDLAAMCERVGEAILVQFLLIVAGQAAGLLTETHTCEKLEVTGADTHKLETLKPLGVDVRVSNDGTCHMITGLPPRLTKKIMDHVHPEGWCEHVAIWHRECRCSIKSALVPSHDPQGWKEAMANSPYGQDVVTDLWPYLGITAAGPTMGE